jgi:hypothetical protein
MSEQVNPVPAEERESSSGLLLSVEPLEKSEKLYATDTVDGGADGGGAKSTDTDLSDSEDSDGTDSTSGGDSDGTDGTVSGDSDGSDSGDSDGSDTVDADGSDAS